MRILAISKRVLKELLRDKRTLALMFLAPILIMWLMNVMFSANSTTNVSQGTVNVTQPIQNNLKKVDGVTVTSLSAKHAEQKFKDNSIDSIIKFDKSKNKYDVTYANTDSSKTMLTKQALRSAITGETMSSLAKGMQQLQATVHTMNPNISISENSNGSPSISNHYRYGNSDTGFFAKIVPILMGFFVFFFVFRRL
ncbi:MAG: ABC transporter permease [Candidatus Limosilactobacillus intestinavium]